MAITKVTTPELIDLPNNQLVTGVSTTYNITVISSGGNKYAVNGTQQANITLIPGTTYTINQDDSTNNAHPLILSTSTVAAGVYSTGVTYSLNGAGVSYASYISGFATATQRKLTITLSSPPTLNYICYYHTGMGGSIITTPGLANTDGVVLSKGTTATRPASAVDGEFRYNTTTKKVEYYDGVGWFTLDSSTIVPQSGTTGACNYPITATALYQLNDNANDTCGSNDAVATNITYTTGNFGNAAVFSGSSSYITTPVDFSTFTDYSVSMWIYPTANNKFFAGTTDGSALNGFYLSINSSDQIRFYERNGSTTSSSLTSSNTISLNAWNFITAVRDGSTNYIYVNGIVTSLANSTITQSNDFTFGRMGLYTANPYTGNIDQVRIFPSALTATQVGYLYTETAP